MRTTKRLLAAFGCGLLLTAGAASADVGPLSGLTASQWWQMVGSIPTSVNPGTGADCMVGRRWPATVWRNPPSGGSRGLLGPRRSGCAGGWKARRRSTIQVHLPLRDLEAAKAELEAVSDPNSPRYGQYLTSKEFESKHSPTAEDIALLRSYLESEGFAITYSPRNRLFVSARPTAVVVERTFATRLGQCELE